MQQYLSPQFSFRSSFITDLITDAVEFQIRQNCSKFFVHYNGLTVNMSENRVKNLTQSVH